MDRRTYCARHWMSQGSTGMCTRHNQVQAQEYNNNKSFYNDAKLKQGLVPNFNNLNHVPTELCSQGNGRLRVVGPGITSGAITHLNKNIYPWYFTYYSSEPLRFCPRPPQAVCWGFLRGNMQNPNHQPNRWVSKLSGSHRGIGQTKYL